MNNHSPWITKGALILFVISMVVATFALAGWLHQGTERRQDNARAWHAVVCYLEAQVIVSHLPVAQQAKALRLYDHILSLVHAAPCS